MAAGLARRVPRNGRTSQLMGDGVNVLTFDWADIDTLTAHLHRLASGRAVPRRMGVPSHTRAHQFGWDAAVAEYLQFFDQITIGTRPVRRPIEHTVLSQ